MTNFTFIQFDLMTIFNTLANTILYGCIIFLICHYAFKKSKKHKSEEQSSGKSSDNEQRWD